MRTRPLAALLAFAAAAFADTPYRKPPREMLEVLDAPATPATSINPRHDWVALRRGRPHPPVSELARPILRLAGIRIDPAANALASTLYDVEITLVRVADGRTVRIPLPAQPRVTNFEWSPDGRHFAFLHRGAAGVELWCGETASAAPRRVGRFVVGAVLGAPFRWLADGRTLLVQIVPTGRGRPPAAPLAPAGPNAQESAGKKSNLRTYEDLLKDPHDADLFDFYSTVQLALVDRVTGQAAPLGRPGRFFTALPSPDGRYFLVSRIVRPYSYLHRYVSFPREIELWDRSGKTVRELAKLPLAETGPDETPGGARLHGWRPGAPAALWWLEAAGRGDRLLSLAAPFEGAPAEIARLSGRAGGVSWTESGAAAFIAESNRAQRTTRTLAVRPAGGEPPRELSSRGTRDAYRNPGSFVAGGRRGGGGVVEHNGGVYLIGQGSSPEGDRPFLDRLDLATWKTERLFRSSGEQLETVVGLLAADASSWLTRRETATEPPNFYVRTAGRAEARALTHFTDPAPVLRRITRQLVSYERADGVKLSFTLHLPPGYRPGTRLPTVVWAYPREYDDPETAGQLVGSPHRFTIPSGASHLLLPLAGYALLDGATMPVIGKGDRANDAYVEQIVESARAAVEKAAAMGVTDPARVGVGGHSYGAFMTANLLAHSDIFRAGVARSGAYNRSLTPFGFQSERRTIWRAREVYLKMSPFLYADKVDEPLLLIHGEADDNMGTFPIQSERMYEAVRGNGGTARLVMLPHEAHTYRARESIEHTLWEMTAWLDRHVKDAPPRKK